MSKNNKKDKEKENYSLKNSRNKKTLVVIDEDYRRRKSIKGKPTFVDDATGLTYQVLGQEIKVLPDECPICGKRTEKYIFKGEVLEKQKDITGVKCKNCSLVLFKTNTYVEYFGAFKKLKRISEENFRKSLHERKIVSGEIKETIKADETPSQYNNTITKAENSDKETIVRNVKDGKIRATLIPTGRKLPENCNNCGNETYNLIYLIRDNEGKTKTIVGKECPKCSTIYFSAWLYHQNRLFFAQGDEQSDGEKQARHLIDEYIKSSNKRFTSDARKSLVSTNEDIDWILREYLGKVEGTEKRRILSVAMKRNPSVFLLDFCKEYKNEDIEFENQIGALNFEDEKLYKTAIDLIGMISPYPELLLKKISNDRTGQGKIYAEMKKGEFSIQYLSYISTNLELLYDDWLQNEILKRVEVDETFLEYIPYLDLFSNDAREYLNSINDLALINYILQVSITWIEPSESAGWSNEMQCVVDLRNNDLSDEDVDKLEEYFKEIIKNAQKKVSVMDILPPYFDMLITLAESYAGLPLMEELYMAFCEMGVNLDNCEDILASYKSEVLFNRWINTQNSLDMTPKHRVAKQLLINYPDQAPLILAEVMNSGDECFIKNVKIMTDELQIPWVVMNEEDYSAIRANDNKERAIEEDKIEEEKALQCEIDEHKDEMIGCEVNEDDIYTDDFGNHFDFSELKHFLDL
ncbi:hypothetical protein [Butyrivibrio sp. VCB2006]|uniref:hypothetical protein n=1 Tax=Butyrivibrio sp. VCB2006 TaxID=1280679 RepID=UPI0004149F63|nr:hypothetical protein [Butyrivibrio sp. VCB2006]